MCYEKIFINPIEQIRIISQYVSTPALVIYTGETLVPSLLKPQQKNGEHREQVTWPSKTLPASDLGWHVSFQMYVVICLKVQQAIFHFKVTKVWSIPTLIRGALPLPIHRLECNCELELTNLDCFRCFCPPLTLTVISNARGGRRQRGNGGGIGDGGKR